MSEKLNELFILEQKAQKMELINEEVALKIYLEIFDSYTPKLSRTYESCIRLLEKRGQFEKALEICNKAIRGIALNELSGALSKFEAIRDRLDEKLSKVPDEVPTEKVKRPFNYKRFIGLLVVFALVIAIYVFQRPDKELYVNLEGKESLEGGETFIRNTDETKDPTKAFPVTDDMIEVANNEIRLLNDVVDGNTIPQESTLGIAIIVKPGTTEERAKEISDKYVRSLAGAAAATYQELSGPTEESLGSLYDYYELVIVVGYSKAPEDTLAKGTKTKGAKKIYWRKLNA